MLGQLEGTNSTHFEPESSRFLSSWAKSWLVVKCNVGVFAAAAAALSSREHLHLITRWLESLVISSTCLRHRCHNNCANWFGATRAHFPWNDLMMTSQWCGHFWCHTFTVRHHKTTAVAKSYRSLLISYHWKGRKCEHTDSWFISLAKLNTDN